MGAVDDPCVISIAVDCRPPRNSNWSGWVSTAKDDPSFPMMKPVTTAQRIDPVEGFSKTRPAKGRQTAKQRQKWIS